MALELESNYTKITYFNMLLTIISMLIAVAFYTILERKTLSYIQMRKGPNKVGAMGLLQPFSDAIKLFNKSIMTPKSANNTISHLSPPLSLTLSLITISVMPFYTTPPLDNTHTILLFLILSGLSVYSMLLIGWSSNSKYAHLGTMRSIAQMISYEVSFFLIIISMCFMINSYNFSTFSLTQSPNPYSFGFMLLMMMWMLSCLAEVNRSPYDFAEGESELVSGFNVEYMGGWFAMIFLTEYTNMIILALISASLFMYPNPLIMFMFTLTMTMSYLWTRSSYPRFRFDKLMYLNWKIILPTTLFTITLPILISTLN